MKWKSLESATIALYWKIIRIRPATGSYGAIQKPLSGMTPTIVTHTIGHYTTKLYILRNKFDYQMSHCITKLHVLNN